MRFVFSVPRELSTRSRGTFYFCVLGGGSTDVFFREGKPPRRRSIRRKRFPRSLPFAAEYENGFFTRTSSRLAQPTHSLYHFPTWIPGIFARSAKCFTTVVAVQILETGARGLLLGFIFAAVRSCVADWSEVPSASMYPTIFEGDRIIVNKLALRSENCRPQ